MAWQDHRLSPQIQERRGHGLGRRKRAYTQAMPDAKNVENTSPKTHASFTPQELNSYQNVQQNQTNAEAMENA